MYVELDKIQSYNGKSPKRVNTFAKVVRKLFKKMLEQC